MGHFSWGRKHAFAAKLLRNGGRLLLGLTAVLVCSAKARAQQTIWPSTTVPATVDAGSSGPVELGVSFKSDTSGTINGIRFYGSTGNTGTHVGHLWSSAGALLACVTFTGETASAWQQANFSTPVSITANTVYVASCSCDTGYGNTPEWMVDYPPINERIQAGFLNWTQGAAGILYYRADGWTAGNAIGSWNNVDTTACGGGLGRPGDGIFLYPPGPIASTEPAPGIRLKTIRAGIQDYEYAQILKNLGQLSFLNPLVLPIATSWTNWTHSTTALENVRQQLGQQLSQLAPPGL